jgi:DNA transformation protein
MKDESLKEFALDQLRGLGDVECRSMFGGFGFYSGEKFFGIIYQGRLYFKTSEATRAVYLEHGMKPFRPRAGQKLGKYYEVPPDVIEDPAQLETWAREAVTVAGK